MFTPHRFNHLNKTMHDGYYYVWITTKGERRRETVHRLVMENKLGRYLVGDETVHHIDENKANNDPENLQLFETNSAHVAYHNERRKNYLVCPSCGESFHSKKWATTCSKKCEGIRRRGKPRGGWENKRVVWPSDEELYRMVWAEPSEAVARRIGVSGSALSRRCKQHQIQKPPRGYWRKLEVGTVRVVRGD